ncbi:MAG: pilus assembly protein PilM [Candidatus Omnitrophica bacterium]|nr:pilus assembly protein PilM [Candidatus Omnitrophota bacterium]
MARSNEVICLSLADEHIKIAHIKGAGPGAKLAHVATRSVAGLTDVEIIAALEKLLKSFPGKSARYVAVVPASMVTTKNIEIPSSDEGEIQSIVNLQASRHTPLSREEIQIGYINLGSKKSNYSQVLLTIANRLQLKDQVKIFEKAGIKASQLIFAPEAIAELYGRSRLQGGAGGSLGIIDIDSRTTHFVIVGNGRVLASRAIPVGREDFEQDAAAAQTKLIDELTKTVDAYLGEDIGDSPSKYLITSEESYTRELLKAIQTKLSWDIQISEYADLLKTPNDVLKELAVTKDVSFLDVMAAGSMVNECKVNLIPEEVQLQKSIEDQRNQVFVTAVLSIILLLLLSCVFYLQLYFKDAYYNKMVSEYEDEAMDVKALHNRDERNTFIRNYLESRMVSLDTIHELYKVVPEDVYLTRVIMEEGGAVRVQGVAETPDNVFELNKTLGSAKLFASSEIVSQKSKLEEDKKVSPFELSLHVQGPDEKMSSTAKAEVEP